VIPYSKRTLDNGLEIIVHEDHHAPLVAVSLWYHTGSKNERVGRTGLAHLFEHLMFEGGAHQPRGFFEPLQEAGAALNGSTSTDRTNYWEVVPKDALRLALWMEADRMGWLVPVLTQARFDTQRDVVINERRQTYENTPYGQAGFAILDALYPPDHPYAWPTIGRTEDLRAATLDDAITFFKTYYHPANASLAIAGDVEPEAAFDLVTDFFAEIPRGPAVRPPVVRRVAPEPRRVMLEDRVELPRLYLTWPSPALFEHGDADLDLAADLVANGRTSRLYARLIHEHRIASEIGANQMSRELGGMFQIQATAAPGQTLDRLREAIDAELGRVATEGPDARELERSRAEFEAAFVFRVQGLGGFGGRADQLNAYNVYRRDPDGFDADLARYLNATVESVRSAVADWIDPRRAVALSVVPRGQTALALAGSELLGA
jgi:zinc protease